MMSSFSSDLWCLKVCNSHSSKNASLWPPLGQISWKLRKSTKLNFFKTLLVRISHKAYTMHKNRPKICTHYGVSAAKIYLYHSSKNTSSRPPLGLSSMYNSVQGFSGSWIKPPLTQLFLAKCNGPNFIKLKRT